MLNRDQKQIKGLDLPDGSVMDIEGLGHFYDVPTVLGLRDPQSKPTSIA